VKPYRRRISTLQLFFFLCVTAAGTSHAHFERIVASARSMSLGGAFVGTADDPGTIVVNPAGLARIGEMAFLTTYLRPYGLDDLDEGYAAAAFPFRFGVLGVSWHHLGMSGATAEDLITVAFGRDLIHNTQDASLSVGASFDLARVSIDDPAVAKSVVTGGFGVLLRPFPAIGLGYAVGNIRQGTFDFFAGGGSTQLTRTQSWGISLEWHKRVRLSVERKKDLSGRWRDHAGLEIVMAPGLMLRSGVDGRYAVAGVGFSWARLTVDVGTASHEYLGSTYVVSLGYRQAKPKGTDGKTP
jgi:hypothetical protein